MSLQQLDPWLHTIEPAPRVDGASMLDGYLTAIVIGPCSIPPDEWFVHLLGERGRIATASGTTMAAITTIVTRFNAISEGLSLAPQQAPLLDLSRIDHGLLLPILLYCTDPLGRPMLGPPREGPETEQFLRETYQDIPLVIPAIRDFWMPQRFQQVGRQA